MIKVMAERINELEVCVTVNEVSFTCEDFLFHDKKSLVDMLKVSKTGLSNKDAKKVADLLHETFKC